MTFNEAGPSPDAGQEAAERAAERVEAGEKPFVSNDLYNEQVMKAQKAVMDLVDREIKIPPDKKEGLKDAVRQQIKIEMAEISNLLNDRAQQNTINLMEGLAGAQAEMVFMLKDMGATLGTQLEEAKDWGYISEDEVDELAANAESLLPIERRGLSKEERQQMLNPPKSFANKVLDTDIPQQIGEKVGKMASKAQESLAAMGTTETFRYCEKLFDEGDAFIAAEVYEDVMQICSSTKDLQQRLDLVIEKYGPVTTMGTGRELAGAVLNKLGVKGGDLARAFDGAATMGNMVLDVAEDVVDIVKDAFLPDNTLANKAVLAATGQKELEGYQKALLMIPNAAQGVAEGIGTLAVGSVKATMNIPETAVKAAEALWNLPETIASAQKMAQEIGESDVLKNAGIQGDLILKIIDQYFSPTEKIALVGQFIAEGFVGAGIGLGVAKLATIPKVGAALATISKVRFVKPAARVAKLTYNVGTSRTTGRLVSTASVDLPTETGDAIADTHGDLGTSESPDNPA
jgi:hypothetical protein